VLSTNEVESLLSKLCVDLGFCLSPEKERILRENMPSDIDGFTNAVFVAEGLNPQHAERSVYRQVRRVVQSAFENQNDVSKSE
jgi:hypothetical protein